MGLVTRVVPLDDLAALARAKAERLASLAPASIRATKQLLRGHTRAHVKRAIVEEAALFASRLGSPEAIEAFTAFFEKRKPDFSSFH